MSEAYSTIGIPTTKTPDGRIWISDFDLYVVGQSAKDFIAAFSNYWTYDPVWGGWVSPIEDD